MKEEKRESWQWNRWRKDQEEADREAENLPEGWKELEKEDKVITVGERISNILSTIVDAEKEKEEQTPKKWKTWTTRP